MPLFALIPRGKNEASTTKEDNILQAERIQEYTEKPNKTVQIDEIASACEPVRVEEKNEEKLQKQDEHIEIHETEDLDINQACKIVVPTAKKNYISIAKENNGDDRKAPLTLKSEENSTLQRIPTSNDNNSRRAGFSNVPLEDVGIFVDEGSELRAEETFIETLSSQNESEKMFDLLDLAPMVSSGMTALVKDSFTPCFSPQREDHWNWNIYLFVSWVVGVIFRYAIAFPLRICIWLFGSVFYAIAYPFVHNVLWKFKKRRAWELALARFYCAVYVAAWTGVVKYHGILPKKEPNQVFVCNHTTVFDICILMQHTCYSIIGQAHNGVLGWLQKYVLCTLDCIWFDRKDMHDRQTVTKRLKEHIADSSKLPLLIFPEGTCVNNEYCIMFKKGAFELDATVCPIAIKYNLNFSDPFWNSRNTSFVVHFLNLCTSWAVVADVYYLEPQRKRENETVIEFADRVKALIAKKAGLINVKWDGYLKYFRPNPRLTDEVQQKFAKSLTQLMAQRSIERSQSGDYLLRRSSSCHSARSSLKRNTSEPRCDVEPKRCVRFESDNPYDTKNEPESSISNSSLMRKRTKVSFGYDSD